MMGKGKMNVLVEPSFDMETHVSNLQGFYEEFMDKLGDAFAKAETKLLWQVAQELGVSEECALKYVEDYLDINVEVIYPNGMMGTPCFNLVATPKPVGEILDNEDKHFGWECEKQLLGDRLNE